MDGLVSRGGRSNEQFVVSVTCDVTQVKMGGWIKPRIMEACVLWTRETEF
jgi:hypothetical protein